MSGISGLTNEHDEFENDFDEMDFNNIQNVEEVPYLNQAPLQQTGTISNNTINEENSINNYTSGQTHELDYHQINRISDVSGLLDGYEAQQLQSDPAEAFQSEEYPATGSSARSLYR